MQLSPNQEIFSHFFPEFLKSPQNLEYYEKKWWPSEGSEIIDCNKRSYLNAQTAPR